MFEHEVDCNDYKHEGSCGVDCKHKTGKVFLQRLRSIGKFGKYKTGKAGNYEINAYIDDDGRVLKHIRAETSTFPSGT